MNKLKTWRELIILAAIAAVLLLYIIFRTAGNINYKLPVLPQLDADIIDRITVTSPQTELEFIKQEEKWLIGPENWIADKSMLKTIAGALSDLKAADLISSSGVLNMYNLDENDRITVKAYSADEVLREIYVGKVSSSGIYTYVMFPGDKNIYSVRGDLPSRFSGDKKSMRDKEVLSVPREGVLKLSLSSGDGAPVTIFKDGSGVFRGSSESGLEADDAEVKGVIPVLSPLRCTDFPEALPSEAPERTLEIQTTEGSITLELWPKTDKGYPARSSQTPYPVLLTSYTTEKILGIFGLNFQ